MIDCIVNGNPRITLPLLPHNSQYPSFASPRHGKKLCVWCRAASPDIVGVHEFNNGLFCSESPWVVCTLRERALVESSLGYRGAAVYRPTSLASSALPYSRTPPTWLKATPREDVVEHICKLARKGLTPSQIGVTLRDSHGIPQVRFVTGNKILRILKSSGQSLWCDITGSIC